jgi:hypothetical protein
MTSTYVEAKLEKGKAVALRRLRFREASMMEKLDISLGILEYDQASQLLLGLMSLYDDGLRLCTKGYGDLPDPLGGQREFLNKLEACR